MQSYKPMYHVVTLRIRLCSIIIENDSSSLLVCCVCMDMDIVVDIWFCNTPQKALYCIHQDDANGMGIPLTWYGGEIIFKMTLQFIFMPCLATSNMEGTINIV